MPNCRMTIIEQEEEAPQKHRFASFQASSIWATELTKVVWDLRKPRIARILSSFRFRDERQQKRNFVKQIQGF